MGAGPGTGLEGPVVLEATGLVKRYGDHAAVDGTDLGAVAGARLFRWTPTEEH